MSGAFGIAVHVHAADIRNDGHERFGEGRAEEGADAFLERCARGKAVDLASVEGEREAHVRVGEGVDGEGGADVSFLGDERAQELAPGGDVAEEVAHLDACAGRRAAGLHLGKRAGVDDDARPFLRVGAARGEGEAGDGGDGGDRLAAEAERGDALDVVHVADLRRGVALEGEQGVLAVHAAAVVAHGDERASAGGDVDIDARGTGVEGVFEKFFQDGRGALHDLACGDFVGDVVREESDVSVGRHGLAVEREVAADEGGDVEVLVVPHRRVRVAEAVGAS